MPLVFENCKEPLNCRSFVRKQYFFPSWSFTDFSVAAQTRLLYWRLTVIRFMVTIVRLLTLIPAIAISLFIIGANYYQWRIRRRFSGVIGRIMFWYSLGLAAMLALTVWNWVAGIFDLGTTQLLWGDSLTFLLAAFFFFKGSIVIR